MEKTKSFTKVRLVSICMVIAFLANIMPIDAVQASGLLKTKKSINSTHDVGNVLHYDGQVNESYKKEEVLAEKVTEKNELNNVDTSSKKDTEQPKEQVVKEPKNEAVISKSGTDTKEKDPKPLNEVKDKAKDKISNVEEKNLVEEKKSNVADKVLDNKEKNIVENFNMFDTAIVGLLGEENTELNKENILKVKTKIPNGNGIWVLEKNRESVINLINQISNKEYCIDENGFVKSNEITKNVGSKLSSEIIDSLINSDKKIIIGKSNGWNEYDIQSQKSVHKTFDNGKKAVTMEENPTEQLVIVSDNNQDNEISLVLIDELMRALKGKDTQSIKEKVTEELKKDVVNTNNNEDKNNNENTKNEENENQAENPVNGKDSKTNEEIVDDKDKEIVKNFDMFDTAIVGLLGEANTELNYENILKVKNKIPEGSGVWILKENRESVLNLINQVADKEYYIDENGFLKSKGITKDVGSKSSSEIIDKLISSDKILVIGRSDGWNEYDAKAQKVVRKTFSDENKGVTIGGKATDQLVLLSDNDSNS